MHALRMARALAMARSGDNTERGMVGAFESLREARGAQARIKAARDAAGFSERVGVWLWQPSSTGTPTTAAGYETGVELRLHPKSGAPKLGPRPPDGRRLECHVSTRARPALQWAFERGMPAAREDWPNVLERTKEKHVMFRSWSAGGPEAAVGQQT